MSNQANGAAHELGWRKIAGSTPRETGRALGAAGRDAVHKHLPSSEYFQLITGEAHAEAVARMAEQTRLRFPKIWEEIEGLAEGLELSLEQTFAWNCRGDLLARTPDGCTTILSAGQSDGPMIAHNEDGLPFFRGSSFIGEFAPEGAPAFRAFCYPGSIPGHTMAFNAAGLVQAVNNIRLTGTEPDVPRMVLGRAVLSAAGLDEAVAILRANANSGGFHFGLACAGDPRLLSVEFGRGEVSVVALSGVNAHANHALHHEIGLKHQIITQSSGDRQIRADALVAEGLDALSILRDTGGAGLPIRRDAEDDPDDENTLGTGIFHIKADGVHWSIYDQSTGPAAYSGVDPRG